jgi:hypothetical protein
MTAVTGMSMASMDKKIKVTSYEPVLSLIRPDRYGPKTIPKPLTIPRMPKPNPKSLGGKIFDRLEKTGVGTSATATAITAIGKRKLVDFETRYSEIDRINPPAPIKI